MPVTAGTAALAATSPGSSSPPVSAPTLGSAGTGCPSTMKVWQPQASGSGATAATKAESLIPAQLTRSRAVAVDNPVLRRIAASPVHWLTKLDCHVTPFTQRPPRSTPRSATITPASVASSCATLSCSPNWSGYVVPFTDDGFTYFDDASMEWSVPAVDEPGNLTAASSIWPGIGGGTGSDDQLVQAGTQSDEIYDFDGLINEKQIFPWIEIYPQESEIEISNLPISAGTQMLVDVEYEPGSTNTALFIMCAGDTCGEATQTIDGTSGGQVEWIAERPTLDVNGVSSN